MINEGYQSIASLFFISILFAYRWIFKGRTSIILINGRKPWEVTATKARKRFIAGARKILLDGFQQSEKGFFVETDAGCGLVLSPRYIDEIRNDARLSFFDHQYDKFHAGLPGFEVFAIHDGGRDTLRLLSNHKLTPSIGKCAETLAAEAQRSLREDWSHDTERHNVILKEKVLQTITSMTSRIFLGDNPCRNDEWYRIIQDASTNVFLTAGDLRIWPKFLRPLVHWFLPKCRALRANVQRARNIINPIVAERRADKESRLRNGVAPIMYTDTLAWAEEVMEGVAYDPAIVQLGLAIASIHTTTDLVTKVLFHLLSNPGLVNELREEIIEVKSKEPWGKPALHKLKLMDSVLKETQRLDPIIMANMNRKARERIVLSDGFVIPKGTNVMVSTHHMRSDASLYKHPATFDGHRFYNLRQKPGWERLSQMVCTSPKHVGFGHGQGACPGRFFGTALAKILLSHIIVEYELCWINDQTLPPSVDYGILIVANPSAEVSIRRISGQLPDPVI